jgi:N-acyl-D-aspartate/D-glutamate deacylase
MAISRGCSAKYVRDEKLISLEQAVYRLTTLPATNLGIKDRGALKPGYYADVVVFDPRDGRRPSDLRKATAICGRYARRLRQRRRAC